jgi:hypothetical protein
MANANDFDSYTQLRQAEDISDEIYIISPVDNPVASMSKTIRANGKLHEWTEDVLQAAGKNAKVEGDVAPNDSSVAVLELSNYAQIMSKTAEISGTLEEVDKYGRDSEMAYQLELRYGEMANDEELAIMGAPGGTRQTAVAGDATTAREMASFFTQLDGSVTADATAVSTVPALETMLLGVHLAVYGAGGNPSYMFVDPTRSQHIASFAYTAGRSRDLHNEKTLVSVIDLYVSNYGELDVILNRQQDDQIALIDFNYLATPVLRPTRDWPIAKLGDSDVRQILRESTFAVLNTKAHGSVDNVAASLAIE